MKNYSIKIPIVVTEFNAYLTGKKVMEKSELTINLTAKNTKDAIKRLEKLIEQMDDDGFDTDDEE